MMQPSIFDSNQSCADQLDQACSHFLGWLDRVGYESYDPYDIWGTCYGLWARKIYYANSRKGIPLVAPLVALDLLCPSVRRLFLRKARYATADAQLILAFLNLYETSGDKRFLTRAVSLGDEMMNYSISGYHGPCWGYPFDWQNSKNEVWPKNTPFITCTPYCYEAYVALLNSTGDGKYRKIAAGIAEFVHADLNETPTGPNSAAGSYSPYDRRQVVNASAYRAFLLRDAGLRFKRLDYLETSERNLNFVLDSQRNNGSWYYSMGGETSFIDNFHTCFNLKNLLKINQIDPTEQVASAILRGYAYYRNHLIDADGNPRSFSMEPRLQLAKLEMYNFAEGITLGTLLQKEHPAAGTLARSLAEKLITQHQLPGGYFVTRVFRGGISHRFPFLRWPQAQLFYALTNLRRAIGANQMIEPAFSKVANS
jgi:hypothetical protein